MAGLLELPTELFESIVLYFKADLDTLRNVALVSSQLTNVARQVLYDSVQFFRVRYLQTANKDEAARFSKSPKDGLTFQLFVRTIHEKPTHASFVRRLVLGDPLIDPVVGEPNRHNYYDDMLHCINLFSGLHYLETSFSESLVERLPRYLPSSLRTLSLTRVDMAYGELIHILYKIKKVDRIHLSLRYNRLRNRDAVLHTLSEEDEGILPIETLKFSYQDLSDPMYLLIGSSKSLKTLNWKLPGSTNMLQVSNILKHPESASWGGSIKDTLVELSLQTMRGFDDWTGHAQWARVDLSGFRALKKLFLHSESFFRRLPSESRGGIYKCLPPGLETIKIVASFSKADLFHKWRYILRNPIEADSTPLVDQSKYNWMVEIAENKLSYFPRLHKLTWIEEVAINASEFRDRVVWDIPDLLTTAYSDAGIFLSIILDTVDSPRERWPILWFVSQSLQQAANGPIPRKPDMNLREDGPIQLPCGTWQETLDDEHSVRLVPMLDLNPIHYDRDMSLVRERISLLKNGPNQFDYWPRRARTRLDALEILQQLPLRDPNDLLIGWPELGT